MKIIEALKDPNILDIRISHEDKWMVWDFENEGLRPVWKVYQKSYCDKKTRTLISTDDEENAIKILVED